MGTEDELGVWEFFDWIIENYFVRIFESMGIMNIVDVFANLWIAFLFGITVKAL